MSLLLPSANACYPLRLPSAFQHSRNRSNTSLNSLDVRSPTKTSDNVDVEMDEVTKKRITLDVRTGSASILTRSNIYVNGGLTIPLNLTEINSTQLQKELMLYFAKEKNKSISFKNLNEWISSETFFLDLISRTWKRMETTVDDANANDETTIKSNGRLFHSICFDESDLYVFGGLMISPQNEYEFVATNDLWKLDLRELKWSLMSRDPQIGRRYNHNMHVLNANDPMKDTKIVIVGGLDNMDNLVDTIDIYNITKGSWETNDKKDYENSGKDKKHHKNNPFTSGSLSTNIDGKPAHVTQGSSFSVLLDNNGEDNNVIPTIGFYSASEKAQSNSPVEKPRTKTKKGKKSKSTGPDLNFEYNNESMLDSSKPDEDNDYQSPIIMLPMIPKAKGTRLYSRKLKNYRGAPTSDEQDKAIPYNLLYPTGDSISCSIIASGFYNTTAASNLHCFVYNVCSCTWTKLCLNCHDSLNNKHRFWKVFVWKSHHQAILLGTHTDDGYLPSVQKFDYLLSISLPMLNGFNRILHEITPNTNIQKKSSLRTPLTPLSIIEHTTQSQPISPISSPHMDTQPEKLDSKRNISLASNQTSQFESYIRYITDPLELESTSSVFPPYAMVLGKDSLEIFGKPLADFEFVTSEGETIGVPMFLLRKRWGRYFDKLIALGYSHVCEDYRTNGVESTLIKFESDINPLLNPSAPKTLSNKFQPNPNKSNDEAKLKVEKRKKNSQNNPPTESITSSSSGMVFRVPFKGCDSEDKTFNGTTSPTPEEKTMMKKMQKSKRTSSLVVPDPVRNRQNSIDSRIQSRRLSHPAKLPNGDLIDEYHPGLKHIQSSHKNNYSRRRLSNQSSRKASIASQGSLLSFVSSSSDRLARTNSRKNSVANMSGASSPKINPLLVNLPPLLREPSETLPIPPLPTNYSMFQALNSITHNRRNSHNLDHIYNDKSSANGSRRNSFTQAKRYSISSDPRYSIASDRSYGHSEDGSSYQKNNQCDKEKRQEGPYIHMRRAGSWSSDGGSDRSNSVVSKEDIPDNGVDIEPLLLPRSLYMPWPAASVRAFAEFFYTGQVNGKWPLSPVTLDLWIMAKVYEIRLLYDLITEVLYSIVGKKEGSILVNCNSLIDLFVSKVNACYDDKEKAKSLMSKNEAFNKLIELRDAVRDIESGFIDTTLMDKQTRIDSFSTLGSTYTDGVEGYANRKLSLSSNNLNKHFRTMHNNSQQSLPQRNFWKNNADTRSLSLAIPEDCQEAGILEQDNDHSKSMEEILEQTEKHADIKTEFFEKTMSDTHVDKTMDLEEHIEQVRLQNLSDIGLESGNASPLTAKRQGSNSIINQSILTADTESLLSSASDSDDLDFLHSEIPLNMMNIKVREEKDEFEGSIDPLFKLSNSKNNSIPSEPNPTNNQPTFNGPISTLENMMSPNALPPVDHVMKYIYRTSVLVNDGGLILRSIECIEFSKKLKKLKTVLTNDILKLEEVTMMVPVAMNKNALDELHIDAIPKFDSEPNIQKPSNISRPPLGGKALSNNIDPFRKTSGPVSLKAGSTTISPRTSAISPDLMSNTNSASMTNIYSGNSTSSSSGIGNFGSRPKKTSRFNSQPSTGLSVLMNPAVMPPPPPSSPSNVKSKRDTTPSNGPLSFLGIKK